MKTSVPYEKIFARFSPARQKKIKTRAAELIAEEFTLRDLRKAKQITQQEVAKRLSGRQVYVSRLERRADMKLSTLREYVRAPAPAFRHCLKDKPNHGVDIMKLRPLHDRVMDRRIEEDNRTSGGIIIPDTAKEKPQEGEVVAVGPGGRDEAGKLIPIDVKPGNRVLFGKWSGTEVKLDGEELLIMKESDIMGVIA